jgi:hypothetical protein
MSDKIKMYKGNRTITPTIDTKAAWEAKGWSDSKEPKKTTKKKTTKKWGNDDG